MAALHAAALPPGWSATAIAGLMDTPGARALIDVESGVTGLILVRAVVDEAEILTIAVAANARRRGIGRNLLDAGTRSARAEGATRVHLEVASNNTAARDFYADAGFTEIGRRARYYPDGADAILMVLGLA